MLDVIVDRKQWYRGKNASYSRLIVTQGPAEDHGKMCCLGFACLQADKTLTPADLVGHAFPSRFGTRIPKALIALAQQPNEEYRLAMKNDNQYITDDEREKGLIEKGKLVGINFSFTG